MVYQRNRRAFLGKLGRVGLVPVGAEVGDLVCVFWGANVPFVLRERERTGGEVFHFVGEAYVYGVMDCEAVGEEREGRSFEIE